MEDTHSYHVGKSNYSKMEIQPWDIWIDYKIKDPFRADVTKRILRTKEEYGMSLEDARALDKKKIVHICKEKLRQISVGDVFTDPIDVEHATIKVSDICRVYNLNADDSNVLSCLLSNIDSKTMYQTIIDILEKDK